MTAQYRVLRAAFIAPHMLKPGMIIETDSPPADHLEPLNDEAKTAMEGYYNKKVEVLDEDGKVKRVFKPNEHKRPSIRDATEAATVSLISVEEYNEKAVVGVTQERVLANKTEGEIQPSETAPKPVKVDNHDTILPKPALKA